MPKTGKYIRLMKRLASMDALPDEAAEKLIRAHIEEDGGPGSGNFGHKGRPGMRGGSGPGGGGSAASGGSGKGSVGTVATTTGGAKRDKASSEKLLSRFKKECSSPGGNPESAKECKKFLDSLEPGTAFRFAEKGKDGKYDWMIKNPDGSFTYTNMYDGGQSKLSSTDVASDLSIFDNPSKALKDFSVPEKGASEKEAYEIAKEAFTDRDPKANLKAIQNANAEYSKIALEKAKEWPEGSQERHQYENWAKILANPATQRPTPEESKAMQEKFLSNISDQLEPYAVEKYKRDVANEPQITNDLCDIADEVGTEMYGLGYRLKKASNSSDGGCRVAEKIADTMNENKCSYEEATDGLSDLVRYTQACTTDNLVDNFEATKSALEKKGYKAVKIKNTWDNYSIDKPYRGVNCVFESPTGTKFELQFHTPESIVGKEVQHGQYEEQRSPRTPEARKKELGRIMYKNMSGMTAPKNIGRIKKYPPG